nr:MAG: hypothetical protein [Bacteroides phage NR01]
MEYNTPNLERQMVYMDTLGYHLYEWNERHYGCNMCNGVER